MSGHAALGGCTSFMGPELVKPLDLESPYERAQEALPRVARAFSGSTHRRVEGVRV